MTKIDLNNNDQLIQLGIAIATIRKSNGLSQDELAEKVGISRSFLGRIEAPNIAQTLSVDNLFNIAKALNVAPDELIRVSMRSNILFG